MRELKRLIAKHNMMLARIHKPFKKYVDGKSYFSKHWRDYVKPRK